MAVVTGASSGLGKEFARALASRKYNLVLVARREEPMQVLASDLRQQHAVDVVIKSLDLSTLGSPLDLQKRLDLRNINLQS